GRPFGIDVRVPDHRRGVERVWHFSDADVQPLQRSPTEVDLANIDAIACLRRGAGEREAAFVAKGHPWRARVLRGLQAQAKVEIIEQVPPQPKAHRITEALPVTVLAAQRIHAAILITEAHVPE